jgi:hypothetical protein
MRTYYPKPSFATKSYQFKLVNSSFIHAIHLAQSLDSFSVGVSFIKDEDVIQWYVHSNSVNVYNKLTDPTRSVGFVFNNTLKGKQYIKTTVASSPKDAPVISPKTSLAEHLLKDASERLQEMKKTAMESVKTPSEKALEDISKIITQLVQDVTPKVTKVSLNSTPDYANTTGPVLHVCTKESTCIFYLALGFDTKTLENVIFYSLNSAPGDVYIIRNASLSTYKDWIKDSLGQYYNKHIKHFTHSVLLRSLAK